MAFPINTDLQFNSGAAAVNFRLWNGSANPTGGTYYQGQLFYNTTDDKVYKRTASAWVDITAGAGAINDVQGTAPIQVNVSTGVATVSIDAASGSNAGSMSASDYTKLANATASNTNSTLVLRDGSGNFAVNMITLNGTPSAGTDAVNVNYLTNALSGFKGMRSVRAATTGTLTITARTSTTLTVGGTTLTIDGTSLANGDVLLVKDNTTGVAGAGAADNGKYTVSGIGSSVVLTRTADMDTAAETDGHFVIVEDGTTNVSTLWSMTAEVTTLGTDSITWVQVNKASDIVAGNGLSFTGLTLNIGAADTSITVNADTIQVALATASGLQVSSGLKIQTDTTTSNTIGVTTTANGAGTKFDANSFTDAGSETLALAAGVAGAGLTLTTGVLAVATGNTGIAVNANDITLTLATNSGLEIVSGLKIKPDTTTAGTLALTLTANGAGVKYNTTSFTETSETLSLASSVAGTGLTLSAGVLSVDNYTVVSGTTVARKYAQTAVSIGSGSPVTVTHNLNTQAVVCMVMDSSGKQIQMVDIVANTVNSVQITALGTNYNADVIVIG